MYQLIMPIFDTGLWSVFNPSRSVGPAVRTGIGSRHHLVFSSCNAAQEQGFVVLLRVNPGMGVIMRGVRPLSAPLFQLKKLKHRY